MTDTEARLPERLSKVRECSSDGCLHRSVPGFAYCDVHATRSELQAAVIRLRGVLEQAVEELDDWRDKGSDVMRDELVDDFIVAAKDALS